MKEAKPKPAKPANPARVYLGEDVAEHIGYGKGNAGAEADRAEIGRADLRDFAGDQV